MNRALSMALVAATASLSACATQSLEQVSAAYAQDATTIGGALDITYRVIANRGDGGCTLPGSDKRTEGPCYEASIEFGAARPIDLAGTQIYFSQVELIDRVEAGGLARIEHVNGDLHRISFAPDAPRIGPGETRSLRFIVKGLGLARAKFMPNYYAVDRDGDIASIVSTKERDAEAMGRKALPFLAPLPANLKRASRDLTPIETAQVTFRENAGVALDAQAIDSGIIPRPLQVEKPAGAERLDLSRGYRPHMDGADEGAFAAAFARLADLGFARQSDGVDLKIRISASAQIRPEGYRLAIGSDTIGIEAVDEAGAFYALQSLAALIVPGQRDLPALVVADAPRFPFRGMHLDIARNFHGPQTIRALIDQMAAYKLNRLHLHLADDEGWRLEIAGLPELTAVGARRCHDLAEDECLLPQLGSGPTTDNSGSGFLSEAEYIALLRYADERHVEIIPALDMPGHARAAVRAMDARYRRMMAEGAGEEEASRYLLSDPDDRTVYSSFQHYTDNTINVCRPSAYRFVGHVLDRLIELHNRAGVQLARYHIGADETAGAWSQSPLCQEFLARADTPADAGALGPYFVARVARMVEDRGVVAGAWSDGLSHADPQALPAQVQSNVWGTLADGGVATAHEHANRGWDVVLSFPDALYFDFPQAAHPEEGGYYWAARRVPARKLFSMMPDNLPLLAAYWKDRDEQPVTIEAQPLDPGRGFVGIQGHIWTETVRDAETLGYQIFPRMFALAERAWHRPDWEIARTGNEGAVTFGDPVVPQNTLDTIQQDWNRFASILVAKELPKLEAAGWSYRLPVPGARITQAGLEMNTALPGLAVECRKGDAWVPAANCTGSPGEGVQLRTTNRTGTRHSRSVDVE